MSQFHENNVGMFQKHGRHTFLLCCHLYQLSATSNNVSSRRKQCWKFQKHGYYDVTLFAFAVIFINFLQLQTMSQFAVNNVGSLRNTDNCDVTLSVSTVTFINFLQLQTNYYKLRQQPNLTRKVHFSAGMRWPSRDSIAPKAC